MNFFFKSLRMRFMTSFKTNTPLIVYSFILAVVFWFIISINFYPETPQAISNIKIDFDKSLETLSTEGGGLEIVSNIDDITLIKSVKIKGNRTQMGSFKNTDLYAVVDLTSVTEAKTYTDLKINVYANDDTKFETLSIDPPIISLKFDKRITEPIGFTVDTQNIKIADDYELLSVITDKNEVMVTGPQQEINDIKSCKLVLTGSKVASQLKTSTVISDINDMEFVFFNENGIAITDTENLTLSQDFKVTLRINMTRMLPLKLTLQNTGQYFNEDWLLENLKISPPELKFSSATDALETINEYHIASIDIRDIGKNFSKTYKIGDIAKVSNVTPESEENIVITLANSDSLDVKEFQQLSEIKLKNTPERFEAEPVSNALYNVKLIGPAVDIARITEKDISLEVDLVNASAAETKAYPVNIVVSEKFPKVWAIGEYNTTVKITEEPKSSEQN